MTDPQNTQENTATDPNNKWDDSEFHPGHQSNWFQQHKLEMGLFAGLLVVLLAVVFWLPKTVHPPAPDQDTFTQANSDASETENSQGAAPVKSQTGPLESPWQDAQIAKARREAQEILAKLLDKQTTLDKMQVDLWAAESFKTASDNAANGDELYRAREFGPALESYQTALQQFEALIEQAEQEFQQAMSDGAQAIIEQQAQDAVDAYTLATAIRPNNEEAKAGLARAQIQDQVIEQLEAAENQVLQSQYQQAKVHIEKALELDSESQLAAAKLKDINQAITEDNFASAMGQGYSYLQQKQYSKAAAEFRKALKIKPGNATAQDAITQASNQLTQNSIQRNLSQAEQYEREEQWQQALASYQAAQQLDSSVVATKIGVLRTRARADLDKKLQNLIDQPLRLADPAVYRSAQQLLADAASVKPRGPRIEQQQQQLQQALNKALDPVAVLLRSDNETNVTLYKVGKLGNFKEHTLELKPGRYTLVGSRNGYRDVREEFTLQPGTNRKTIVIQCDEKIAMGG
ncbi:tetratricopeptide repeat protein [Aestuariicella sp. G3-2]|uniref:tetratricopeptide repeat protein n=1 Tax=Pseudomaricurvus albidus TaxID=2842452 RepID=UPI001C0BB993|nr:tetratricopeptide repeat protein [Aestuariicella albida]MBU3070154.1 tetratricopeptide repeat protein [Aestuariicella albida]